jgi:hypothetical protein
MKTSNKILLGLFILILAGITILMIMFRVSVDRTPGLEGSGRVVRQDREITAFHAIDVSGKIQVELSLGDRESLSLEADDNLLEHLRTEVVDHVLTISLEGWGIRNATLNVAVGFTELEAIEGSGGARIRATDTVQGTFLRHSLASGAYSELELRLEELALDLSGGAHAFLKGEVQKVTAKSSGGSEIRASQLFVEDCSLETSSGSLNELHVTGLLGINASGGSQVNYTGNPLLREVSSSGGARINKL